MLQGVSEYNGRQMNGFSVLKVGFRVLACAKTLSPNILSPLQVSMFFSEPMLRVPKPSKLDFYGRFLHPTFTRNPHS